MFSESDTKERSLVEKCPRGDGSASRMNLAGFLLERAQQKQLGFASWDRVSKDRLSEIIAIAAMEMLFGAEQP